MNNLRKKDRKVKEQIRDYLKKKEYNIPVTIKEDLSEFSNEIKTNNNNNKDDMSNLPFDDFSEINSRQNLRLPTLRDKEEKNLSWLLEKKEELKENNDKKYENFKNRKSRRDSHMKKNENIEN